MGSRAAWYGLVTGILLVCCGPAGLLALWLGPWSVRTRVLVTILWLVIFGPATFFYLNYPKPSPSICVPRAVTRSRSNQRGKVRHAREVARGPLGAAARRDIHFSG